MDSELASNDIRQAIDEAVRRYYDNKPPKGATHKLWTGCYYRCCYGSWQLWSPLSNQWGAIGLSGAVSAEEIGLEKL